MTKKVGLGQGLEALLGSDFKSITEIEDKDKDPDFVWMLGARDKFIKLATNYCEWIYPGCNVYSCGSDGGNVKLICGDFLNIAFRVQTTAASWSVDTLVISNIYYTSERSLLEILSFIMDAQKDLGYFKFGFEFPGKFEMHLIKRFGFEESKEHRGHWSISIAVLKERIAAGSM